MMLMMRVVIDIGIVIVIMTATTTIAITWNTGFLEPTGPEAQRHPVCNYYMCISLSLSLPLSPSLSLSSGFLFVTHCRGDVIAPPVAWCTLRKRELEYGIPRSHSPAHSRRFPETFGDFCKNKTTFLRVFVENRFLLFCSRRLP